MSKISTEEEFDNQRDLLYSYIDKFVNDDSEDFSMGLIEYSNMAYMHGWAKAIDMVLDVVGEMYNSYNFHNPTLDELEQRIV